MDSITSVTLFFTGLMAMAGIVALVSLGLLARAILAERRTGSATSELRRSRPVAGRRARRLAVHRHGSVTGH